MKLNQIKRLQSKETVSPTVGLESRPLVRALVDAIQGMFGGHMPASLRPVIITGLMRTRDDTELRKMLSDVIGTLQSALDSVPCDSTSDEDAPGGRDGDGEIDAGQSLDEDVAGETEPAVDHSRFQAAIQS
jgi:hypothetical protein